MRSAEGATSCQLCAAETAAQTNVTEQIRSGPPLLFSPGSIEFCCTLRLVTEIKTTLEITTLLVVQCV